MMNCFRSALMVLLLMPAALRAEDPAEHPEPKKNDKPIRALLVTGGCCHDYARQKLIITKGVSARANVVWTVVHQGGTATNSKIPLYEDPDWAEGFDIIVHNECFSAVPDPAWVERILKPHRNGTPAVLIHCAMHCYRTGTDAWFEFAGVQSPGHGPHYAYDVENLKPDHFIMKGFGEKWNSTKGELYHTVKLWPTVTPLAQAKRKDNNEPQTCIWTNQYHKGRVFGTTIGHYNETMVDPNYLDMLTRGILWATGRDQEAEFKPTDEKTDDLIRALATSALPSEQSQTLPQKCCGEGNLASGKPTKASSEETGKNNFAKNAVDGDLGTRWCANGSKSNEWWQVDLEQPQHVKSVRIHWEGNAAYRYKIEGSADGEKWTNLVDQSENKKVQRIVGHTVDAPDTRYLRVTFLGSSTGAWGSFWEFEAYPGELPELPASVTSQPSEKPSTVQDVQAPAEFDVTLFATPPEVNYPVCLTTALTGEVFVGVDLQGSLGKKPGQGRVLRCIDMDGDGKADKINVFAEMDHPRGLIYDNGSLWVLHPPFLSVFHDDDLDGTSDRQETLITGISTDQVAQRGADHTTNGIRMGIDGWIYIAVGDFGFNEAKDKAGNVLSRRGGGIVRVRPDGTEMEIYCWGLRNILDVAIDPSMNIFTRDNTNDGGGWDIRFSHIMQSAHYGYPSLYMNYTEEMMPPLAEYGGGSGCGGMFLHDLRWPEKYGNTVYTCDWGRSEVYLHQPLANGPTFDAHQEVFVKIPRPTDIDVDGSGRMYISSWKNGSFNFSGPNVGFVAQLVPRNFLPKPFPELTAASDEELVSYLAHPSAVYQLHSQRELLRRGSSPDRSAALLNSLARNAEAPLYGRAAAIFTLKQLDGAEANPALVKLLADPLVQEFALRALTDRKSQLDNVPLQPILDALKSSNPRVQAQAAISLGRLGKPEAAEALLTISIPKSNTTPAHNQPDPARVISHLAVRALAALKADEACATAIDGPYSVGALQALKWIHTEAAVNGLIQKLSTTRNQALRQEILTTLVRLYYREGDYKDGNNWWGTRPDTSGPYYDRATWDGSKTIAGVILNVLQEGSPATREHMVKQLVRHKVKFEGLPDLAKLEIPLEEPPREIVVPTADPNDPNAIGNRKPEQVTEIAIKTPGDPNKGKALFSQQSCNACHTYANGQTPKGPHLVDIGKRYKRPELVQSVLDPSAKIAQGFDSWTFVTVEGKIYNGFITSESAEDIQIRQTNGLPVTLVRTEIDEQVKQEQSMMPKGLVNNLTPEQLADLLAYLESLK